MDLYAAEVADSLTAADTVRFEVLRPTTQPSAGLLRRKVQKFVDRYVLLPKALRRSEANLVHILDQGYAHLVGAVKPRKVIVTCHDLTPLTSPHYLSPGWLLFRFLAAPQIRNADRLVAVSDATRDELIHRLAIDPERITVAYYGLDEVFFNALWEGPGSAIRLLHVGADVPYKRVWLLVDAALELARRGHSIELWKVGGPLGRGDVARLEQATVSVRQFGTIPHRELPGVYAQASLLVFPSSSEGFGRPVAEAMAVGLPVVASGIGVLREITGGNAIHVQAGDAPAYADAIEAAASDLPRLRHLSEQGREFATRYRWDEHARRLSRLYSEL
jgi:glycosyltransferase involved in cell wall biosynthesis